MIDPETIIDGRYRVLSRLGSGGMADVYLAQDTLLGRQVAVKVLHHHFAEDQEFVERFRREASSAAALSHPNIVAIFDRGEWNGTYYIAMEYVAGRSLKEIVRERGALEPAAAIDVVVQILRAARFAHKRGVIHRDLKPHNVIIDEEGRARVTDFGIARAGASDMTLTGSIMGTAQYLSPEQAQGLVVSAASDLYSVGVILYELLTGAVPFEGETAVAIAFKQVSAEPLAPSALRPGLPPSLDAVVLRALAKDPAQRYADADELIVALEAARGMLPASAAGRSGAAAPHGAAHGQDHGAHAPPPRAGAGSLLLAQHGTGRYQAVGGPLADEHPEGHTQEEGPGWRRAAAWTLAVLLALAVAAGIVLELTPPASRTVTVPSVTGQSEAQALTALRAADLVPAPTPASNATVPSGDVVSQQPAAGSSAEKGTRVTIVVSNGPGTAPLIDVTGLNATKAEAKLHEARYHTKRKLEASKTVKSGLVIGTEPAAETPLRQGQLVTLVVSTGPAPVRVPDLMGDTREAAESALTNAELEVGAVTMKVSTTATPGTVIAQSPSGGAQVSTGSKVTLTVAKAPKELEVPSVIGETEAAATVTLTHAGFKAKRETRATTEATQIGTVLEQTPAAGSHERKGASVTIVVGTAAPPTTSTPTTSTPTTTTTTTTTSASTPPAGE
jgi:beta-lactam-binding protein with PASTA domain/predicted Ser/Thr protein kinase